MEKMGSSPPNSYLTLKKIAKRLKRRSQEVHELELTQEQELGPFIASWASYGRFREAMSLKRLLLREFEGAKLEEVYSGTIKSNSYGQSFCTSSYAPQSISVFDQRSCQERIVSNLKLLYGIGPIVERQLKQSGYETIIDLTEHPRWHGQAQELLQSLQTGDLRELQQKISHWLPVSHPLALSLTGMVKRAKLVLFDLESMGLFGRPLILLGVARPQDDELMINQYLIRSVTEEISALVEFLKELDGDTALVTYNGRAFDVNYVEERLSYYGLYRKIDLPNFDLLHHVRRRWRGVLPNCCLETVEQELLGIERPVDVPSALVPDFYNTYLEEGNIGPLVAVIEHNKQDLLTLEALLTKLCSESYIGGAG